MVIYRTPIFWITLVMLYSSFTEERISQQGYAVTILEQDCYLIDSQYVDTLYLSSLRSKKSKQIKPFAVASTKPFTYKIKMKEFLNDAESFIYLDRHTLLALLDDIYLEKNSDNQIAREFYNTVYSKSVSGSSNGTNETRHEGKYITNQNYYVILMRGSRLNLSTSMGHYGFEGYNNCYFRVLCPK